MSNLIVITASALAVLCAPVLALLASAPPDVGGVALVIAPPWRGGAAAVAVAVGLREVAPEAAPLGSLVLLETPQDVARLYDQGAWFVVNGQKVLELCAT
jgi:type IV secretory pathway protease TraF